jgi:hypothetical protein
MRGVLAAVGAVLLSVAGGAFSAPAQAAYRIGPQGGADGYDGIGIQPFWFVSAADHVTFSDIGGSCDRAKVYPSESVGSQIGARFLGFYLYTAYAGGSCFFEGSNAQFRVEVTEPSGGKLWTNINVTETSFSSRKYRVDCYGNNATLPCKGETRLQYSQMGPVVWFGDPGGPSGYTWCSVEGYGCTGPPAYATISEAYGANGHFVYRTETLGRSSLFSCTGYGRDPAPGFLKSCLYKVL